MIFTIESRILEPVVKNFSTNGERTQSRPSEVTKVTSYGSQLGKRKTRLLYLNSPLYKNSLQFQG